MTDTVAEVKELIANLRSDPTWPGHALQAADTLERFIAPAPVMPLAEINAIFGNLLTDIQSMGMKDCGLAIGPVGKARSAIIAALTNTTGGRE